MFRNVVCLICFGVEDAEIPCSEVVFGWQEETRQIKLWMEARDGWSKKELKMYDERISLKSLSRNKFLLNYGRQKNKDVHSLKDFNMFRVLNPVPMGIVLHTL